MDREKLLMEFIDGNLNYRQEKKLFKYLKSDFELRSELKQFCSIGLNYQNSTDFLPSSTSTDRLFSNLNFQNKRKVPKGLLFKFEDFFNRLSPFASAIASAILTASVLLALILPNIEWQNDEQIPLASNSSNIIKNDNYKSSPKMDDRKSISSTSNFKKTDTLIKYIYLKQNPDTIVINTVTEKSKSDIPVSYSSIVESPVKKINYNQPEFTTSEQFVSPKIRLYEFDKPIVEDRDISTKDMLGFSIELRGSSYWNLPYTWIQPSTYMNFKNTGISLFYKLSDQLKLGAEIRQETFYQKFDDETYVYEQQPNFITGGLSLRYYPINFGKFYPFAQGNIGYNAAGLVLRPMIGLEYRPYSDLSFIIAGDYSYLYFRQGLKYFGANKVGFHYGISYSF